MIQLSQGETFHGGFALFQEDGVTPTEISQDMSAMVVLSQVGRVKYKCTTADGSLSSMGGGQYTFSVPPEATERMMGEVVVELKVYDEQNQEVVIGKPSNPRKPVSVFVTANIIHAQK